MILTLVERYHALFFFFSSYLTLSKFPQKLFFILIQGNCKTEYEQLRGIPFRIMMLYPGRNSSQLHELELSQSICARPREAVRIHWTREVVGVLTLYLVYEPRCHSLMSLLVADLRCCCTTLIRLVVTLWCHSLMSRLMNELLCCCRLLIRRVVTLWCHSLMSRIVIDLRCFLYFSNTPYCDSLMS